MHQGKDKRIATSRWGVCSEPTGRGGGTALSFGARIRASLSRLFTVHNHIFGLCLSCVSQRRPVLWVGSHRRLYGKVVRASLLSRSLPHSWDVLHGASTREEVLDRVGGNIDRFTAMGRCMFRRTKAGGDS